jgi:serine/threonine-protein kinase
MPPRRALQIVPMALDRRIGTQVGGYRILELLGRGGTSAVYLAEHVRLGRPAALKLLAPNFGEADFRDRFLRESQLAASLEHPSIVPVYDAGEDDDLLYIAMARIEGSDLKSLLAREARLPLRRALRIVGQIGSALDAAHARGLVHRDVKPANILVGADDRAYLSDFGVVKELASNGTTRTGSFVGTIEYCAPEQIEGRAVDGRADVYALACVLYECLSGTPPFHRPSEVAVLNAHLHAQPPKLSRAVPELPASLDAVIAKALSKSPLDRHASCAEFLAAARAAVAAEPRVHRRRLALSIALLALAVAVGAGGALGIRSLVVSDHRSTPRAALPRPPSPPRQQPATLDDLLLKSNDGRTLNDTAFALIGAKAYKRAIPFARKAILKSPVGSLTRGYATFNLGYALLEVGNCRESLVFLRRALAREPKPYHPYITPKIRLAKQCVRNGASARAPSRSSAGATGPSRAR